jgi:hypothetical protein
MRQLRKEEYDLIAYMLRDKPEFESFIDKDLKDSMVEEMNDGGMGSLKFLSVSNVKSIMKDEVARIDLRDVDNIPLSITLNTNTDGEIYEMDVFKGDFSHLKKFPTIPFNEE